MNEKIYTLAEKMTTIRNTKLFDALIKTTGQAFVIVFLMSGLLFVNTLLPLNFKLTRFIDAISKVYALLPLFVAYYFGSNLKDRELGIISAICTALFLSFEASAITVILAYFLTFVVSIINILVEYLLDKVRFPKAIPSMAHEVFMKWVVNVVTLIGSVLVCAVMTKMTFLTTLASIILTIGVSPIFYFAIIILSGLFWTVGLHGDRLTGPFFETFIFIALFHNLVGMETAHIINSSFHVVFASGSGSGITMGLIIALLLFSKDKESKTIAKDNIVSGFFNINEGVVFGLPIVDNKRYILPFMIAPIVSAAYGYIMTLLGILDPFVYAIPWVTPPLLKSFIASGGNITAVLVELGAYVLCIAVYVPFVLKANKEQQNG